MEKLDVLYMCDNGFAGVAGVSLTSLFENNPCDKITVTVYLLLVCVNQENCQKFTLLSQKYHQTIHLIDASTALTDLTNTNIPTYRGSAMTNLRLYFDRYIPEDVSRLLYLDCDTLICGSLEELANFTLKGKLLGMVRDAYGDLLEKTPDKEYCYYNAGVLLIDCRRWRSEQWQSRILDYANTYGADFAHPDQDLYNIVCKKEIIQLPIRFNFQTIHRMYSEKLYFRYMPSRNYYSEAEIAAARENAVILHMIRALGGNPWNACNVHPDSPLFFKYKNASPWKTEPAVPLKRDSLIMVEKFLYKILPLSFFFPLSLWAIKIIQLIDKNNKY